MSKCVLCPRRCGMDRGASVGFCSVPEEILVARAAPHFGEEPCISGSHGSGTVFFAGCNLKCVFCQNHAISRGEGGQPVTVERLRDIFGQLQDQGVHNINLVTGSHYSDAIAQALEMAQLRVPVVWNSSAYESVEQLRRLEGLVQVYLPDFKYADRALAKQLSLAEDYPDVALAAIGEMYRQTGPFQMDEEGLLRSGVLIRHLILPGHVENSLRVMDAIEDHLDPKGILFSLMSQYTPMPGLEAFPELQRTVSEAEYERCLSYFDFSAMEYGFCQSPDSATEDMIPAFDGTGV